MIYVEMYGRLGNQMFRYAFARAMQEKCKDKNMILSFNQINDIKSNNLTEFGWEDALQYFNVKPYKIYKKKGKVILNESNLVQRFICMFYYLGLKRFNVEEKIEQYNYSLKYMKILNKFGIYWLREGYYNFLPCNIKNKFISGSFEDPRYFEEIRDKLITEFTPKYDILSKNIDLYNIINSSNSICVTIRRGDFISVEENKKLHYVCNEDYFYRAMDIIAKKVNNPKFIIFSDDIEWVKNNMNFKYDVLYEEGNDPIWEKLRLMYSCKNFIISNSTFSWWAQYLSRNERKIVISPNRWFNNEYESKLIDNKWILLDV